MSVVVERHAMTTELQLEKCRTILPLESAIKIGASLFAKCISDALSIFAVII
jgi:hypothetical protein